MKVSKVVKTAVKLAPIVIPIVKKVIAAKKGTNPNVTKKNNNKAYFQQTEIRLFVILLQNMFDYDRSLLFQHATQQAL